MENTYNTKAINNASKSIMPVNPVEDVPTDPFAQQIHRAMKENNIFLFKQVVNPGNINTYFSVKGGEYTPVLYLARKSPKGSKAMLEHCMELGADLTLKAQTSDCLGLFQNKRCTTIGNLAGYRQSKVDFIYAMTVYDLLMKIYNGELVFTSDRANINALKYRNNIPGFDSLSIARRRLRATVKGVAAAPASAVAAAGLGAAAVGGTVLGAAYLGSKILGSTAGRSAALFSAGRSLLGGRRTRRRKSRKTRTCRGKTHSRKN
jgi:hypothetical protein